MVDIPIQNKNALQAVLFNGILGRNGNIVKQAKPHGMVVFRMVPRGTHHGKHGRKFLFYQGIDSLNGCPGGQIRCLQGMFRHDSVPAVQNHGCALGRVLHVFQIPLVVVQKDPLISSRFRLTVRELLPDAFFLKMFANCP